MGDTVTIAHLSDLHCGDPHFVPDLMERAIAEINALKPDAVVCSGDLTTFGFKEEYAEAKAYLDKLECDSFVVVPADLKIFVLHHHLLPVPGTGRERNVVYDAGDAIECLQRAGVHLVLSGHKHVPYAWRLENLFVVNTGTVSSLRLRGNTRPCYNVIEVSGTHVAIWRRYPFHGQEQIIQFDLATLEYEKYTGKIEREVTSQR